VVDSVSLGCIVCPSQCPHCSNSSVLLVLLICSRERHLVKDKTDKRSIDLMSWDLTARKLRVCVSYHKHGWKAFILPHFWYISGHATAGTIWEFSLLFHPAPLPPQKKRRQQNGCDSSGRDMVVRNAHNVLTLFFLYNGLRSLQN